jgi:hypothetical protein
VKTDVTTYGSYAQSQAKAKNLKAMEASKLKEGTKLAAKDKLPVGSPDYKLDLSKAQTPATSTSSTMPSLPDLPGVSTPSAPSTPKPSLKAEEVVKDQAKDQAVSGAKDAAEKKVEETKAIEVKDGTLKKPAIIFIKGLDVFSSPSKSEGGYAGVGRMADAVKGSRMYGWNQKDEIIAEIKKREKSQPIILVGHSFGGDTAVEVANELDSLEHNFRPVNLLITMDAIGFNNDIIPQNVKKHLNIFGETSWFLNDGPHVARRHELTDVKNILSPLDHTDIDDDKGIQYEIINMINSALA